MPFSSLLEFEKWHKSIQRRCNHASRQPGDKTGAGCYLPLSHSRCDDGPRHQPMAKRDEKQEAATGDGARVLLFSPPTLAKIHSSPTPEEGTGNRIRNGPIGKENNHWGSDRIELPCLKFPSSPTLFEKEGEVMLCSCGTETIKRPNRRGDMCDYCPKCRKFVNFAQIMIINHR